LSGSYQIALLFIQLSTGVVFRLAAPFLFPSVEIPRQKGGDLRNSSLAAKKLKQQSKTSRERIRREMEEEQEEDEKSDEDL